jgi:ribonucleoside-diphosphate reductase alpha chain
VAQLLAEYLEHAQAEGSEESEGGNGFHYLSESVLSGTQPEEAHIEQQSFFKVGDLCPECGQASVVNEEGCRKCYSCGYSEC